MSEEEAREAARSLVGDAALATLERLAALVIAENERQNLIARSTVPTIWSRHLLDSVQLLRWAGSAERAWLDIGTGGGFPGLAVATATERPVVLVEPRRRRAAFLAEAAAALDLPHVSVRAARVETVTDHAAIISARAVAPIENLLRAAGHCATSATIWLLLRGVVEEPEMAALRRRHRDRMFHVEQSLSDPGSSIVRIEGRAAR